jgi:hypothetical protein
MFEDRSENRRNSVKPVRAVGRNEIVRLYPVGSGLVRQKRLTVLRAGLKQSRVVEENNLVYFQGDVDGCWSDGGCREGT